MKAGNKTSVRNSCFIYSGHIKGLISVQHQQKDKQMVSEVYRWRLQCLGGGGSLVFLRVLIRSPTEGSRVEEEAGFSFYLFCGLYIGFCFPLCNIVQVIYIDWENAFYTVFHKSFECTYRWSSVFLSSLQ